MKLSVRKWLTERRLVNAIACLSAILLVITGSGLWQINRPRVIDWESQISSFETMDEVNTPPEDSILFVGSSSIRRWEGIQKDFPSHPVIRRGIGGAHIDDVTVFADRIVIPYEPQMVLLYAGDNDLAFHRDPTLVLEDFKEFVLEIEKELPRTRIGFISIKPSIARWPLVRKVRAANRLVREYAQTQPKISFVDVFNPMLDSDGKLKEIYFSEDGLHLSRRGYRLWRDVIRSELPVKEE